MNIPSSLNGRWHVEDGLLCTQPRGDKLKCVAARLADGLLMLQRPNGEIIRLEPR